MKDALAQNPVTSVAAVGAIVAAVGYGLGWSAEAVGHVTTATLGLALLARGAIAWWDARHA